jgi:hypothetical protein
MIIELQKSIANSYLNGRPLDSSQSLILQKHGYLCVKVKMHDSRTLREEKKMPHHQNVCRSSC